MENCKQKNVPETRKMFTISHFLNVIQHVGERTYRCRIVASLGYIMQHGESYINIHRIQPATRKDGPQQQDVSDCAFDRTVSKRFVHVKERISPSTK